MTPPLIPGKSPMPPRFHGSANPQPACKGSFGPAPAMRPLLPAIVAVFAGSAIPPPGSDSDPQIVPAKFRQVPRSGASATGLPPAVSKPDCAPREKPTHEDSLAIVRAASAETTAGTIP